MVDPQEVEGESSEDQLQALVCVLAELVDDDVSLPEMWEILTIPGRSNAESPHSPSFGNCVRSISQILHDTTISITSLHHVGHSSLPLCTETAAAAHCCYLLCCIALQRLDAAIFLQRPRRYQSLQLETLLALHRIQDGQHQVEKRRRRRRQRLYIDYILPATAHVQRLVVAHRHATTAIPDWTTTHSMLYTAVTVQIVTDLLVEDPAVEPFPDMLYASTIGCSSFDCVWQHCWRTYHCSDTDTEEEEEGTLPIDPVHAALVKIAHGNENPWNFQSSWPDQGVALLMARFWMLRPMVWSITYQWHVFFPYVDALLLVDSSREKEADDTMSEDQWNDASVQLGFQLLRGLLEGTSTISVKPSSYNAQDDAIPDNPIRSLQVVANYIVAASAKQRAPSAPEAYQLLRRLLYVYPPQLQVQLVEILVERCPFPSLQPKLVDLWRGFGTWSDPDAIAQVLDYCDRTSLQILLSDTTTMRNDDSIDIEMHLALLSLIEVAPTEARLTYSDRLRRLQERISSRPTPSEQSTTTTMLNGWDMLCLTLDRMLG